MRVTKCRKSATSFDIKIDGVRVGGAHFGRDGAGFSVASLARGIDWYNSWAEGVTFASELDAAEAGVAYVKKALAEPAGAAK